MKAFAPAKINLTLAVCAKAADGYHPLSSLVAFADCGDVLEFAPADDISLRIHGPFGASLNAGPDNLVMRAALALHAATNCQKGAAISLHKILPVASGLGGGSADAAATLRALNQLWKCGLSMQDLEELGGALGADIPVCIQSRSRIMRGHGNILEDLPGWPVLDAVLVNPGVALSTKAVFDRFDALGLDGPLDDGAPGPAAAPDAALAILANRPNALTPAACALAPAIADLLTMLSAQKQTRLARLCGSGATCMALTENAQDAATLAAAISAAHRDDWVQAVRLGGRIHGQKFGSETPLSI